MSAVHATSISIVLCTTQSPILILLLTLHNALINTGMVLSYLWVLKSFIHFYGTCFVQCVRDMWSMWALGCTVYWTRPKEEKNGAQLKTQAEVEKRAKEQEGRTKLADRKD